MNKIIVSSISLHRFLKPIKALQNRGCIISDTLIQVENGKLYIGCIDESLEVERSNDFTFRVGFKHFVCLYDVVKHLAEQPLVLQFEEESYIKILQPIYI